MENWREGTRTGHTHEPNDVTVQLDGLGRQLSELPVEPSPPDPSDGPVFVDESGRRSKTYRRVGWVLAAICAVYAVTLVAAVLGGNSSAPWLPLSGQEEKHAEEVEVRPAPSDATLSESPGATPTASASVSGDPGATPSGSAASAAGGSAGPGASASASTSGKPPRTGTSSNPVVPGSPVSEQPTGDPSPSVTADPPVEESPPASPDPSESPVQPEGVQ
ncbi:hypothetical protein PV394_25800 [Streptomyces sp. NE06-03E]|uniref:Uncharacterized protein n=1 Tax=Streptomyces sp. gb1(2016) TaxID=1828321 RepID=A0A652KJY3_9ACTN|nr:hypothetical protein [Streptomyces sp. NE06-03E]MDX3328007.1 hypothetical protein [Streptomyces sp. ME02-6979-3A]MDX3429085.1 hypothetical protein [Streptomyces sp. ME01-18a]MDX3687112.1 hypothetical protein [Streptomyces sp. AK04-4c]TXS23962.1 hypothetical protein EAO74_25940 [Streptomyces sp. gb1(2016)]WSS62209.1 hypothetical protein OG284_13665 [Streptomyces sp. NBC_01177]WSS69233.1 hypothetical protein OG491_13420 [Streptomyces sp. NBC_01175]